MMGVGGGQDAGVVHGGAQGVSAFGAVGPLAEGCGGVEQFDAEQVEREGRDAPRPGARSAGPDRQGEQHLAEV